MILTNHTPITRIGEFKEFFYKVNPENLGALFHLLRNQLYSDKLSAILREYGTNAADAHTETDQTRPFEVRLPTEISPALRIRDFGPGLALEELEFIYTSMGETTKNQSNLLNGCQGIGCKSAFSYSPTFEVISRHENTITHALAYIDETRRGKMTILETGDLPAGETQGLEIIIPILKEDFDALETKARKVFEAFALPPKVFRGSSEIEIRSKLRGLPVRLIKKDWGNPHRAWAYSGNVCYPVDPDAAGLPDPERTLSSLVFEMPIGSIHFTASRESLEYTETTKKALQEALNGHIQRCRKKTERAFTLLRLAVGTGKGTGQKVPTELLLWQAHLLNLRILKKNDDHKKHGQATRAFHDLQTLGGLKMGGQELPSIPHLKFPCLIWHKTSGEWQQIPCLLTALKNKGGKQILPWGKTRVFVAYKPGFIGPKNKVPLGASRKMIRWSPCGPKNKTPDAWAKAAADIIERENLDTAIFPVGIKLPTILEDKTRKNPRILENEIREFLHRAGIAPKGCIIPIPTEKPPQENKPERREPAAPRKPKKQKTRVALYACLHVGAKNQIVSPKHGELLSKGPKGTKAPVVFGTGLAYPWGKPEAWWDGLEYKDGTKPDIVWTGQTKENPTFGPETHNVLKRAQHLACVLDIAWEKTLVVTVIPPEDGTKTEQRKTLRAWKPRDISKSSRKAYLRKAAGHCESARQLVRLAKTLGPMALGEIPLLKGIRKGALPFRSTDIGTILGKAIETQSKKETKIQEALLKRRPMLEYIHLPAGTPDTKFLQTLEEYLKKG